MYIASLYLIQSTYLIATGYVYSLRAGLQATDKKKEKKTISNRSNKPRRLRA